MKYDYGEQILNYVRVYRRSHISMLKIWSTRGVHNSFRREGIHGRNRNKTIDMSAESDVWKLTLVGY